MQDKILARYKLHLHAPKSAPPTSAESYNPPAGAILTPEEVLVLSAAHVRIAAAMATLLLVARAGTRVAESRTGGEAARVPAAALLCDAARACVQVSGS